MLCFAHESSRVSGKASTHAGAICEEARGLAGLGVAMAQRETNDYRRACSRDREGNGRRDQQTRSAPRSLGTGCRVNRRERRKTREKHGRYATAEYAAWSAMLQRCTNPNHPRYTLYGARG